MGYNVAGRAKLASTHWHTQKEGCIIGIEGERGKNGG